MGLRALARYVLPTPSGLLPMDKGTWLRELSSPPLESEQENRITLLYFLPSAQRLDQLKKVLELYGSEIQIVAVVPASSNSKELGQELLKQLSCPILIDNSHVDLARGYKIGANDMPVGLLFSGREQFFTTIAVHQNLLERVRHAFLYQEQQ